MTVCNRWLTILRCASATVAIVMAPALYAQSTPPAEDDAKVQVDAKDDSPAKTKKLDPNYPAFFRLDYSGDFWSSPALTGDWGGSRTELANHGISFKIEVLQFIQGNAHGGKGKGAEYFGSADYILEFDTYRMGLWPGGYFRLRGETPWGRGANQYIGAASSPNYDALFPEPNDPGLTTLTEAWVLQALSEKVFIMAGKVDFSRLPGQNVFASDYYTQFMNMSLWQNPVAFATVPYTAMTFGVGYKPTDWFDGATMILDSYGSPTRTGFETSFGSPSGLTILQTLNFHYKICELPGNSRFMGTWSNRQRTAFDDIPRLGLSELASPSLSIRNLRAPGRTLRFLSRSLLSNILAPETENRDWMVGYDFDQYLYQEPDDPTQGVGVFGRFGWSPGKVNPIAALYSIGLGGMGVIPTRDRDRFGIGYYYLDFSGDLPSLLGLSHEQGVELYYNIEVTPWLHITPDVQVIFNPGGGSGFDDRDTSFAYGLRAHLSF